MERRTVKGKERKIGKGEKREQWTGNSIFWNIVIKLVLKVHLSVTVFPHDPSHVLRKQQVMAREVNNKV